MHLAERLGLPRGRRLRAGLIGLAITYVLAGINHFVNPAFYLGIMPSFMAAPALMVAASGAPEVGLGLAVLPPSTRRLAGWGLVAMLLVFCVVHVDMVVRPAEYPGVPYAVALLRLPVQALLIAWARWLPGTWTELLFTGREGQMLRRDSPYFRQDRYLGRVLERADFSADYITCHGFRHTFSSLYMMSGGELFRLQRILGHQSIETGARKD